MNFWNYDSYLLVELEERFILRNEGKCARFPEGRGDEKVGLVLVEDFVDVLTVDEMFGSWR